LVSLSELCLDPYYRTLEGFQVLIEKDWISFGHKFADRCGHLHHDEKQFIVVVDSIIKDMMQNKFYYNSQQRETSPIFHQFLDCVYQLICLYPTRFEFNERLLIDLHYHVYSCQFGTFLFDCEAERVQHNPQKKTWSIWDYFNSDRNSFTNDLYDPLRDKDVVNDGGVLIPDSIKVNYWPALFNRDDVGSSVSSPRDTSSNNSTV
jgi:hypothetical protein